MKRIKNKGKMIKMQENKNLNIDNEKNCFYKTYEYKSKKALKIFLDLHGKRGKIPLRLQSIWKRIFQN